MKKITLPKKNFRAVDTSEIKFDDESGTMEFSFSSEVPYERYFGLEIISHDKGAMNLERLNAAAPLLFNHDMDKQIGVIEKAWIGDDKRGYVKVRFSKSAFAQEKLQDIKDGILRGVSFGYIVEEMIMSKKGEPNEYTVTKSFPYEVSAVTVPADYSVGIARALETNEQIEIEEPGEIETPPVQEKQAAAKTAPERNITMDDIKVVQAEAVKAERERIAGITALCERHGMNDLAKGMIENGKSIDETRAAVLERMGQVQKPVKETDGLIGMSDKEVKQFSFLRAINAMANPTDRKAQEAAGYEREVSLAAADKAGKASRGFMVPFDVLRGQRDLVVGTAASGGNLVATNLLAQSFIELLRKKSVLQRAGVQTLNGLVGNIAIPRMTGAATAYWIGEGAAPTESQQAFDQVTMSPKTVGAFTDFSRKLTLQSSLDVENMVKMDLATVLALEIDRVGLYGSGSSNQPLGLKTTAGINTVDFTANIPTFAEVVQLETEIAADNADVASMKYLFNAAMRGGLKTKEKATGYPVYLLDGGSLNGYSTEVSNQIEANDIWFGNWNDFMMGFWSGLDLMVDPYTNSTSGTIRVVAHQDVDMAVRHPESFARGNNTL